MTNEQQREACAELARRMGWTTREITGFTLPVWDTPDGKNFQQFPPNPFASAEDSRELVAWLLSDNCDTEWNEIVFLSELMKNYSYLWQPGKVGFNAGEVRSIIFRALAAEPSIIARAACKALGIEVSE